MKKVTIVASYEGDSIRNATENRLRFVCRTQDATVEQVEKDTMHMTVTVTALCPDNTVEALKAHLGDAVTAVEHIDDELLKKRVVQDATPFASRGG